MVSQKNEFCSLLVRIWLKIVRQLISTLFENIFCSKYKKTCSKWDYSRVTSGIPPSAMGLFSLGEIQNSCAKLNFPSGKQPHSLGGDPRCHTRLSLTFHSFFVFFTEYFSNNVENSYFSNSADCSSTVISGLASMGCVWRFTGRILTQISHFLILSKPTTVKGWVIESKIHLCA